MNLLATLLLLLVPPDSTGRLMPVPASIEWGQGRFRLDSTFSLTPAGPARRDGRLIRGLSRFIRRAQLQTGLVLNQGSGGRGLQLFVAGPGEPVQSPGEDESYVLSIGSSGGRLEARTPVGALHGLETLLQLIEADSAGWFLPAVTIRDQPRFPWRGLLIDVGRHWEPPEVIKRQLDGMAAVKLNVLHWHLSEDQGFRVESLRYPRLHRQGSDGQYYTQAQIREIVAYARDRGIRVVPEFDMPGHSTAWFAGYPGYASAPGPYAIERRFGVFPPTFDPTREATYRFLERFIGEMARLFPDRYWHLGGDEVEGSQWRNSARIRRFMRARGLADRDALQAYFNRRLSVILTRNGKRMVGWDEILHPDLPKTTVVQSWRGQGWLAHGAKQGYAGILSAGWYLDHMRSAEFHYLVDPLGGDSTLTAAEASRVLGGEACMWGEHVTPESIDSRIWPRLGAIAERLWSPGTVRDVGDMYRRLGILRQRLELLGLGHEAHTPRMARRLADGHDPAPLEAVLSLTEPVSFGERSSRQRLTQLVPLAFAVDAARPDPPAHWAFRSLVARFLSGSPDAAETGRQLDSAFASWLGLRPQVEALARKAPLARDVIPATLALERVAEIGRAALAARAEPEKGEFVRTRLAALDSLARPQGLLRLSVIPAVRLLVSGAAAAAP